MVFARTILSSIQSISFEKKQASRLDFYMCSCAVNNLHDKFWSR